MPIAANGFIFFMGTDDKRIKTCILYFVWQISPVCPSNQS